MLKFLVQPSVPSTALQMVTMFWFVPAAEGCTSTKPRSAKERERPMVRREVKGIECSE